MLLRQITAVRPAKEALSLSDRATIYYNVLPSLELIYVARNIREQ